MIKTLKKVQRQDKEPLQSYRSAQDVIPLEQVYGDGIFMVQKGRGKYEHKFSATYRLQDINYLTVSTEMKKQLFLAWSAVLNVLDPGSINKLSVIKHRLTTANMSQFLFRSTNPAFEKIQKEYNEVLLEKSTRGSGMVQEIYLTISVNKRDHAAAKNFFARTEAAIQAQLARLGTNCTKLSTVERLKLLHDIYRAGREDEPPFDPEQAKRLGSGAKNYLAPDAISRTEDYFRLGAMYGRALVLHSYPSVLRDTIIGDLTGELDRNLIWTMDIIPVPMDEAIHDAESAAANAEGNIFKWFQKQQQRQNFATTPPYDLEQQRQQAREYLHDLTERDQHLMYGVVTMVHLADSKEQLDVDTDALTATARTAQCRLDILRGQQIDGLNTALPIGVRRVEDVMTLTTEGIAGFIPYRTVERQDQGGSYWGLNAISKNMLMVNPDTLQSANSVVLGGPGSGKSFFAKRTQILGKVLATAGDKREVILIDPEREYWALTREMGGEVVRISSNAQTHINAMELGRDTVGADHPLTLKTEFMHSLCEQIIAPEPLSAEQKSLIDRCTGYCFADYVRGGYQGDSPTLIDFHRILKAQSETEAQPLALAIEMFATGSLNAFAKPTNVDIDNRIICFDILDLGESMKGLGMLILFDHIWNRIVRNRAKGIQTSVICDEFYLMFAYEYTTNFFYKAWKRGRKYGADFCGITQNVDDLLHNPIARTILANSELLVLFNQSPTDLEQLAELLNISEAQQEYISNSKVGSGLLKIGGNLIPFEDDFPRDTRIYQLLTTRPDEAMREE